MCGTDVAVSAGVCVVVCGRTRVGVPRPRKPGRSRLPQAPPRWARARGRIASSTAPRPVPSGQTRSPPYTEPRTQASSTVTGHSLAFRPLTSPEGHEARVRLGDRHKAARSLLADNTAAFLRRPRPAPISRVASWEHDRAHGAGAPERRPFRGVRPLCYGRPSPVSCSRVLPETCPGLPRTPTPAALSGLHPRGAQTTEKRPAFDLVPFAAALCPSVDAHTVTLAFDRDGKCSF